LSFAATVLNVNSSCFQALPNKKEGGILKEDRKH
jgi:hypothetical protein